MSAQISPLTVDTISNPQGIAEEQHSLLHSLALHILPGIFILTVFVVTAPLTLRAGLPPLLPMLFGAVLGLAFQVWHLYTEGRKRNGKWSLEGIVGYRAPLPLWQFTALVFGCVFLAFLINGLAAPLGALLLNLMPWLPEWFEMRDLTLLSAYPRHLLIVTFGLYLLINGLAAPIIEELYFRGHLMPRLARFGRLTPIIETALFTFYHFWQPYYWLTVFLGMLPVVYAVWWKRNVWLGIVIHLLLNCIGGLLTFALVLGQG